MREVRLQQPCLVQADGERVIRCCLPASRNLLFGDVELSAHAQNTMQIITGLHAPLHSRRVATYVLAEIYFWVLGAACITLKSGSMHEWRCHVPLTSHIIWADEVVEVEMVRLGRVLLYVHGVEDAVRPDDIVPRSAHHTAVLATLPPQPCHAQRLGGGGVGCAHLVPADKSRLHRLAGLVEAAEEEAELAEPGFSVVPPANAIIVLVYREHNMLDASIICSSSQLRMQSLNPK